ncbi:LytTR family DNA-binding domain-containing protein [Vitiosangium sp. GDMCC 1.1324]|uniref:LytR/AlgR family response regulator transcription factor n=1 Tax=Vitiosangium sp. (strain GDMCC 1.1324) TaxID=2138576 RepID=UPI000D3A3931|nr:LytTR family DNA-binding domain-containing protein [Vitiosangium sp. GDMCC 1.1324]PTL78042.1 DNA-binding response regulator [Vitiosangium sp. GDMCC 1.1324]
MTSPLRALLVDDERLARVELRELLSEYPQVKVVGEADGVASALAQIEALQPTLLFLDVQMPGEGGFELLARLPERPFELVFVTAYDAHALRAFEVNALDYLLKPVHPERLARTVARLAAREQGKREPVPGTARPKLAEGDMLFLENGAKSRFVRVDQIVCLCGAGDYAEVVMADGSRTLSSRPLKEWESRLPERLFARIHRSSLVNLSFVERVDRGLSGGGEVYLRGLAAPLLLSRSHAAVLRERFG